MPLKILIAPGPAGRQRVERLVYEALVTAVAFAVTVAGLPVRAGTYSRLAPDAPLTMGAVITYVPAARFSRVVVALKVWLKPLGPETVTVLGAPDGTLPTLIVSEPVLGGGGVVPPPPLPLPAPHAVSNPVVAARQNHSAEFRQPVATWRGNLI
jgi:hypothetical protein